MLGVLVAGVAFSRVTGLSLDVHPSNRLIFIPLGFVLLLSYLVGISFGGWLWFRVAKRFFNVTRAEMQSLLIGNISKRPNYPSNSALGALQRYLDKSNQRAIGKLYGDK